MWKIFRRTHSIAVTFAVAAVAALSMGGEANAQSTFINQNISGFNLPGVQLPQGSDEVRAADGTTCRSAVSGSGSYLDVGLIGNPEQSNTSSSFSAYTRIVVPLGHKPKRLDCSRLYDLEVRRLEIELKLVELGLNRGIAPVSEVDNTTTASSDGTDAQKASDGDKPIQVAQAKEESWVDDGWTTDGLKE